MASTGDWPWASGGYYTQWFWLHAVPENLVTIPNITGWSWPTGGYYTQWFWLHAVPDNWVGQAAQPTWPWSTGGYYTQALWLNIIPDHTGNAYYDKTFWANAVPSQWIPVTGLNVGGVSNVGYYYGWLYRFGTTRGIAPKPNAVLNGDSDAGYYAYQIQVAHKNDPALAGLSDLAGGYLAGAKTARPVNQWYNSN